MDKSWRRRAVKECLSGEPSRVLDICCGTADLALNIATESVKPVDIAGLDYSEPMLEIAVDKLSHIAGNKQVSFIHGDASRLPFREKSLDAVGISFAFRNMTYKNPLAAAHLKEVYRVLAEGGRYVIVESSQPESKFINRFFRLYCRYVVYWIGYIVSRNSGAYRYLSESAANFYTPVEVREMLLQAGFKEVKYRPLFFGAAGIHVALK